MPFIRFRIKMHHPVPSLTITQLPTLCCIDPAVTTASGILPHYYPRGLSKFPPARIDHEAANHSVLSSLSESDPSQYNLSCHGARSKGRQRNAIVLLHRILGNNSCQSNRYHTRRALTFNTIVFWLESQRDVEVANP